MPNPDPNTLYKQSFRALAENLGRVPNTRDREWLEIHDTYKRAWGPTASQTRALPETPAGGSPVPSTREAEDPPSLPLSGPRVNENGVGDRTTGEAGNGAGSIDEGATVTATGGRGPNGGVMATCVGCGRVWERERKRGRPNLVCGECR